MSLGIVTVGLDSRVSATCIESLGLRLTGAGFGKQVGITDFPSSVFEALQHPPGGQSTAAGRADLSTSSSPHMCSR